MTVNNRTSYGAIARYSCDMNYTLVGEENRTCGDDGNWSGIQPQCLCKLSSKDR